MKRIVCFHLASVSVQGQTSASLDKQRNGEVCFVRFSKLDGLCQNGKPYISKN